MLSRNNPQIWKLAEWLHVNIVTGRYSVDWEYQYVEYKESMYDKAKKLFYMFAYNAFTGPDNHKD